VPEIVPAYRGEVRVLEERLEEAIDYVLSVEGVPLSVAKTRSEALYEFTLSRGASLKETKAVRELLKGFREQTSSS
jgi:hypothetical protein